MESILGKVMAGLILLLAIATAAIYMGVGITNADTSNIVAATQIITSNIIGDYSRNQSGYQTLSNSTVIAANEAPNFLLRDGQIVSPWGGDDNRPDDGKQQ